MAVVRPLKYVDTDGGQLIQMTDADLAYTRWVVATHWANNEMPGHLRINSAPSGWSSIGNSTDTRRGAGHVSIDVSGKNSPNDGNPDAEPGYNINSLSLGTVTTNFNFYENFNESGATASSAQHSQFAFAVPSTATVAYVPQTISTQDMYDTLIDDLIQEVEQAILPGRYYLGTSVPAGYTDTGYTTVDTIQTLGASQTSDIPIVVNTYRLSQLRSTTAPTVVRPLFFENGSNAGNDQPNLKQMSDQDMIDFFLPYLKNRINEGGRLVYTMGTGTGGIDCGGWTDTAYASSTTNTSTKIYTRTMTGSPTTVTNWYLRLTNT